MRKISVGVLFMFLGCGHFAALTGSGDGGLKLDDSDRQKIERAYVGRDFVLASSLYTTDFFGDTTRQFADARPFEIVRVFRHTGEPVEAGVPKGEVVPAGTPVKVKGIEYPVGAFAATLDSRADHVLWPTGQTWVTVERTDKPSAQPLVLVLPKDIDGAPKFEAELQKRLASQAWLTSWLSQSNPEHLAKVFQKEVTPGMSRAALFAALGEARNAAEQENTGSLEYVADYGDLQITLQGNVVSKVVSLKGEAAEARQLADTAAAKVRADAEVQRAQAEQEHLQQEATDKQRRADDEKARLAAEQKAEVDRVNAAKHHEAASKQAELQARLEAAKLAKVEVERDRLRKIEEAKVAAQIAKAEAQAAVARKKAEVEIAKAEGEAAVARQKLEVAEREADAVRGRHSESSKARVATPPASTSATANASPAVPVAVAPPSPRRVGVKLQILTPSKAEDLGLEGGSGGASILDVTAGGIAERSGLKSGDVVLAVEGQPVRNPEDFTRMVGTTLATQSVKLTVWRDHKKTTVTILPDGDETKATPSPAAERKDLLPKRRSGESSTHAE